MELVILLMVLGLAAATLLAVLAAERAQLKAPPPLVTTAAKLRSRSPGRAPVVARQPGTDSYDAIICELLRSDPDFAARVARVERHRS